MPTFMIIVVLRLLTGSCMLISLGMVLSAFPNVGNTVIWLVLVSLWITMVADRLDKERLASEAFEKAKEVLNAKRSAHNEQGGPT